MFAIFLGSSDYFLMTIPTGFALMVTLLSFPSFSKLESQVIKKERKKMWPNLKVMFENGQDHGMHIHLARRMIWPMAAPWWWEGLHPIAVFCSLCCCIKSVLGIGIHSAMLVKRTLKCRWLQATLKMAACADRQYGTNPAGSSATSRKHFRSGA